MRFCVPSTLSALFALLTTYSHCHAADPNLVQFNRDIRPIFADNCYACHGPDANQRKAGLRLDTKEGAMAETENGRTLVPGRPQDSLLYQKITANDSRKRMPPAKFGKSLTPSQISLIENWIQQGSTWQDHWSYLPIMRPDIPHQKQREITHTAIDHFIAARLKREGLRLSADADRWTLIRRLSFDLLGLPPAPQDVDAFVADSTTGAYEKMVDKLLASQHFGERMALFWLDLVRYADTGGYHSDNHRDIYLYRDYVIKAFNDNKRFDQFTIEQLAGDLLPQPSIEQKIASGYNRLLMTTEEGGAQPKEYMAKYSADRVRNVSSVWLGATLGCAECHNHKFDPYTMKDFYGLAAFFADINERAVGRQEQTPILNSRQEQMLKEIDQRIAELNQQLNTSTPALESAQFKWEEEILLKDVRKQPKAIVPILLIDPNKRSEEQKKALAGHYRSLAPLLAATRRTMAEAKRRREDLLRTVPTTLVSMSVAPRTMRVLPRGNWLDDSGPTVQPSAPAFLPPLSGSSSRASRLELAHWLVNPKNPLVARVFVNRLWKLVFGQGIVKTPDDFGTQGAWPTHPELLDWLASEFVASGWDVKHMLRLMVLSQSYRQSSRASEALRQRDPYNQLFARQARFRLDAEVVRDNALGVSGLLSRKIGGKSVKPYQPEGYWQYLNFPKRTYEKDRGEDQYRRGLYTYWQRTFLHPSLAAFDAPSREECTVDRPRSNTPLQALVLLNDPTYVEAARALAERMIREGGAQDDDRIGFAYRQVLSRSADAGEVAVLRELIARHRRQYQNDRKAADALLTVGDRAPNKDIDPAELAAWTSAARVMLNLHETITRN